MLYFLHIPKAAGTSIRHLFSRIYGSDLIEIYRGIDPEYVNQLKKICRPTSVLFGHYQFSLHVLFGDQNARYMAILREPVERVISWYNHEKHDPNGRFHERIRRDGLTLGEMIEQGLASQTNNHMVRILSGDYLNSKLKYKLLDVTSSRFMGKQIYQFNGKRYLDAAVANLNNYFVFLTTVPYLDQLRNFMGVENNINPDAIEIPRVNVSPEAEVINDSQTIAAIRKANELDIVLYSKVAEKLEAGAKWHPLEVRPRTWLVDLNVARLATVPPARKSAQVSDRRRTAGRVL